jgi:hypothetical protein
MLQSVCPSERFVGLNELWIFRLVPDFNIDWDTEVMKFVVLLLIHSRDVLECYLKLGHDHFFSLLPGLIKTCSMYWGEVHTLCVSLLFIQPTVFFAFIYSAHRVLRFYLFSPLCSSLISVPRFFCSPFYFVFVPHLSPLVQCLLPKCDVILLDPLDLFFPHLFSPISSFCILVPIVSSYFLYSLRLFVFSWQPSFIFFLISHHLSRVSAAPIRLQLYWTSYPLIHSVFRIKPQCFVCFSWTFIEHKLFYFQNENCVHS